MNVKTSPFDVAQYIDTPEAEAELLRDAFETCDAGYVAHALGIIARARGLAQIARQCGMERDELFRALSSEASPRMEALVRVAEAMGVDVSSIPSALPS